MIPGLLPDHEIARLSREERLIFPFESEKIRSSGGNPIASYGLSSAGYDLSCADEWQVLNPGHLGRVVDIHNMPEKTYLKSQSPYLDLRPGWFTLARSIEYIRMPEDVMAIVIGKSTWARLGIQMPMTPIEPGWEGYLTLEISNPTMQTIRVHAGEGICQVLFFRMAEPPVAAYGDGKYQKQMEVTLPKL